MKQPEFITFTGIDDRTDLHRADDLASKFPIEWGVLFSSANRDARFPCQQAVREIVEISGRKSAHLCGAVALDAQKGVVDRNIPLNSFGRVQINGNRVNKECLASLSDEFNVDVILQCREQQFVQSDFFQLFDLSGGKGVMPKKIPPLPTYEQLVGYAGGIGPDTVIDYLTTIQGSGRFWIDMEGRVRTNGWFDLDLVERVCNQVFA